MPNPSGYGYVRRDEYIKRQVRWALEDEQRRSRQPDPVWLAVQQAYLAAPPGKRKLRPTAESVAECMKPPMSADTLARRLREIGIDDFREVHRRMGR